MKGKHQGLFITFEGGEGSGKGAHTKLLHEYLKSKYDVISGREPGTTKIGEEIRKILQDPNKPELHPRLELLLYEAARVNFIEEIVLPAIKQGKIFISDRFYDSTTAYQGALGLDRNIIKILNKFASFGLNPDLSFLIDINAELGLGVLEGYEFREKLDKIERRTLEYHKKVNQIYRQTAQQNSRFRIIPYRYKKLDEMQKEIREYVDEFITENNLECKLLKS